jgi:hypothetical protein
VPGAAKYNVWQRRTNAAEWEATPVSADVTGTSVKLKGVRGDDWLFGVSAVAANGAQSPIAAAVPGGAFAPIAQ